MAEKKTEETTKDVADALRETTQFMTNSIMAAQERNLKFIQTTFTSAMEVMKSHVEATHALMQELEQQQEAWQKRVPGMQTEMSMLSIPLSTQPEPSTTPGQGLISARQFARDHGVEEAGRTAFKRQSIPTTKVEGDSAHYLSLEQRHAALSYWSKHNTKGFHPCSDPLCTCHELV
jgi:hypothetical protein